MGGGPKPLPRVPRENCVHCRSHRHSVDGCCHWVFPFRSRGNNHAEPANQKSACSLGNDQAQNQCRCISHTEIAKPTNNHRAPDSATNARSGGDAKSGFARARSNSVGRNNPCGGRRNGAKGRTQRPPFTALRLDQDKRSQLPVYDRRPRPRVYPVCHLSDRWCRKEALSWGDIVPPERHLRPDYQRHKRRIIHSPRRQCFEGMHCDSSQGMARI